jgi:hypothetical protein
MERTPTLFIFRDRCGAVLIQQQCVMDSGPGQRCASWLLCNDCSDLALVLGDDGEAPAWISQPAILEGALAFAADAKR